MLLLSNIVYGQQKEMLVDYSYWGLKIPQPAVERETTKEDIFKFDYNLNPRYISASEAAPGNGTYYSVQYKGSGDFTGKKAINYTVIVKGGDLNAKQVGPDEVREYTPMGSTTRAKEFRRNFDVSFPTILIVKKGPDTVKIVYMYQEGQRVRMLFDKEMTKADPYAPAVWYSSSAEIDALGTAAIYRILEKKMIQNVYQSVHYTLSHLFGNNTMDYEVYYGIIKKKKREFDFSDFDAALDTMKLAVKAKEKSSPEADKLFTSSLQTFKRLLQSGEPRIDNNAKAILNYNLAQCSFWLDDNAACKNYLDDFNKHPFSAFEKGMNASLQQWIANRKLRDNLKGKVTFL